MEKLVNLLNEYERETFPEEHEYVKFQDGTDDDGGYRYYREQPNMGEYKGFNYSSRSDKRNSELNQLLIISKEFGFIKWLVENDKIDLESHCRITSIERKGEKDVYRDEVDSLLMLLSIQDEPIEFLLSILK